MGKQSSFHSDYKSYFEVIWFHKSKFVGQIGSGIFWQACQWIFASMTQNMIMIVPRTRFDQRWFEGLHFCSCLLTTSTDWGRKNKKEPGSLIDRDLKALQGFLFVYLCFIGFMLLACFFLNKPTANNLLFLFFLPKIHCALCHYIKVPILPLVLWIVPLRSHCKLTAPGFTCKKTHESHLNTDKSLLVKCPT